MTIALNRISNANNLSNEDDKMFYRWLCSFIVVFIFIFTCGCTPFTTSWQKTTNSSSASTTTNLEEDIEIEPNLQIISAQVGLLMSGVAGTQDGAYELRSYYDGTADIIYYDYKTQQAVFLSPNPNVQHDESSTAFIPTTLGGVFPAASDDKFFAIKMGSPEMVQRNGKAGIPMIYQMDLSGANRITYTFPEKYIIDVQSAIAYGNENLYLMALSYDLESHAVAYNTLIRVNANKGECVELYKFGADQMVTIEGTYKNCLVVHIVTSPDNVSDLSSKETFLQRTHEICLLPVNPSQPKESIFKWKQPEASVLFYNGKVYVLPQTNLSVYSIDIVSKEKQIICEEIFAEGFVVNSASFFDEGRDNHLFLRLYDSGHNNAQAVTLDLNTQQFSPLKLYYEEYGAQQLVGIFAESENEFLVCTGKDSMQIEFKSPDGTPESGEMNYFIYKLIAKKDYWAGIPQYKEFENNTLANS